MDLRHFIYFTEFVLYYMFNKCYYFKEWFNLSGVTLKRKSTQDISICILMLIVIWCR